MADTDTQDFRGDSTHQNEMDNSQTQVAPSQDQNGTVATTEAGAGGGGGGGDELNQQQPRPQQQQQPQPANHWQMIKSFMFRMLIIYLISSFFRRSTTPDAGQEGSDSSTMAQPGQNLFKKGALMDIRMYVSEEERFSEFEDDSALFWELEAVEYGDWESGPDRDGAYHHSSALQASQSLMNNGSLYLHIFVTKSGLSPNPQDKGYSKKFTFYKTKRLNRFKKRKHHNTVNLLTGKTEALPELVKKVDQKMSHWHPNLTINLVDDHTPWTSKSIPAPLKEYIEFHPSGSYYPVIFFNDYWNLNNEYMPINHTTPELQLSLTFSPVSLWKWQMYASQGMKSQWSQLLGEDMMEEDEDDQDSIKTAFIETNPILLALTIAVSILHSIFEFLAFKNDIQFWKSRESLEGLSVRSVFFNVFQSLVVLLYVLDNETNTVVRISCLVGLGIDLWKITRVTSVGLDWDRPLLGVLPRPTLTDKATYTQSTTKQYDLLAFKYLSWALFPLLLAYAVYSLFYQEHRGWYSFILNMLYGFLLTFGFIMMTPQLFINYKLKSVAHLPWRMMTYKALNTFIDDIFAFVIKMPMLYRLGCFRDDIVFLIYLYQRWIYPVDLKRLNEYGTSGEMHQGPPTTTSTSTPAIPAIPGTEPDQQVDDQNSLQEKSHTDKKNE